MTIFYVNQASQSYKNDKKVCCCDYFIIGQVIPALNVPADLTDYQVKPDEVKIMRPKYDVDSGKFLGLDETLDFFIVRGDKNECFFDYGYSKENSNILYSTCKRKIRNSFCGMIFNNHTIQYQGGVFLNNDHSNIYLFLPSTTDRSEKHNQYMDSVRLWPIDIKPSDFGEYLDPSKLHQVNGEDREKSRECVLNVLGKVVDLSNQNLIRNANCLLAKRPHNKQDNLWFGKKRKDISEKFALSY